VMVVGGNIHLVVLQGGETWIGLQRH